MICPLLLNLLLPVCIFVCVCSQSSPQKRKCVFQVTAKNYNTYATEGNVSELVQHCKSTQCCVAYGAVVNGQPVVDVLGEKGKVLRRGCSSAEVSLLCLWIRASLTVYFASLSLCGIWNILCFCSMWSQSWKALSWFNLQGDKALWWPWHYVCLQRGPLQRKHHLGHRIGRARAQPRPAQFWR